MESENENENHPSINAAKENKMKSSENILHHAWHVPFSARAQPAQLARYVFAGFSLPSSLCFLDL